MVLLVAIAVVIGSCTGEEKRPPATGSACQGNSCKTDSEQASADANRVEQLTTTISTLKQAITNNRQLSAAEIDELQQQLEAKNTELQTVGDQSDKVVELQQTVDGLRGELTAREKEIETLNTAHQEKIEELNNSISILENDLTSAIASKQHDIEEWQTRLNTAKSRLSTLEAQHTIDLSRQRDKIAELEGQLAQARTPIVDGAPPEDTQATETAPKGGNSSAGPPPETPATPVCQAELCAYYVFNKNSEGKDEVRLAVEKGSAGNNLTITSGTVRGQNNSKHLVIDVYVWAVKNASPVCYYTQMLKEQFAKKATKQQLTVKGARLCRRYIR